MRAPRKSSKFGVVIAEPDIEFKMAVRRVLQKSVKFELFADVSRPDELFRRVCSNGVALLIISGEFWGERTFEAIKDILQIRKITIICVSLDYTKSAYAYESGVYMFLLRTHYGEPIFMFEKRLKNALNALSTKSVDSIMQNNYAHNQTADFLEPEPKYHPDVLLASKPAKTKGPKIVAIGASTGGVEAITKIVTKLPTGLPPILIAQHIPPIFSQNFVERVNMLSKCNVKEAKNGEVLENSTIYFAPAEAHLAVDRVDGVGYLAKIMDGPKISRHKPSVDILFRSLNNAAGGGAMAIILTGMGDDGAIGIKEIFDSGGYTLAQDRESCVVFGMGDAAIKNGAIKKVAPLDFIADEILSFASAEYLKAGFLR